MSKKTSTPEPGGALKFTFRVQAHERDEFEKVVAAEMRVNRAARFPRSAVEAMFWERARNKFPHIFEDTK